MASDHAHTTGLVVRDVRIAQTTEGCALFRRLRDPRRGTTCVELALVLPILLMIYFALIEFGHCYMTSQLLKTAARKAARYGVSVGKTTAQVRTEVQNVLKAAMDPTKATIYVKDGSAFETEGATPPTNYSTLPNVEVNNLESRELFIVRVEVPYNSISLFPNGFWHTHLHNLTLSGQSVVRHE
jgi:Flp pilus assembly protein TadG